MDPIRSKRIVEELTKRGATNPCPRCGHGHFEMVAETNYQLSRSGGGTADTFVVVPAVMIACANCGYISSHALASLDMMPEVVRAAG